MSVGGIQFLQNIFSGQADNISVYTIWPYTQLCNLFLSEYIILILPCGHSSYSFHFIYKIPNVDQSATRKLRIR